MFHCTLAIIVLLCIVGLLYPIIRIRFEELVSELTLEQHFIFALMDHIRQEIGRTAHYRSQYTIDAFSSVKTSREAIIAAVKDANDLICNFHLIRGIRGRHHILKRLKSLIADECIRIAYVWSQIYILSSMKEKESFLVYLQSLHVNKSSEVLRMLRTAILHPDFDWLVAHIRYIYEKDAIFRKLACDMSTQEQTEATGMLKAASSAAVLATRNAIDAFLADPNLPNVHPKTKEIEKLLVHRMNSLAKMRQIMQPYAEKQGLIA